MPTIIDGTLGLTTPTYGGADTSEYLVPVTQFKNRIINGAMVIDQRNAGASVTITTSNQYSVDRWQGIASTSSKFSLQQNAGSVTPPVGFTKYLGATSLSAYSVLTADTFNIRQNIEGFNVADLGWGSANAKTVTLSFQVYSSLTGTFGATINNGAFNRSYPFTYSIPVANTWTSISITIVGDTTGTWATDNTSGLAINFSLGAGSTYLGTAGSWSGSTFLGATGQTSVVGTNGATFYITGVQLEVGSTATSFDYRSYGTELALCQRYYQRDTGNTNTAFGSGLQSTTTTSHFYITYPTMRASPTFTFSNIGSTDRNSYDTSNTLSATLAGTTSACLDTTHSAVGSALRPALLISRATGAYIERSIEL